MWRSVRCSRLLLGLALLLFLLIPLVVHYFWLQDLSRNSEHNSAHALASGGATHLDGVHLDNALDQLAAAELVRKTLGLSGDPSGPVDGPASEKRIQDLMRIKHSVQNELQTLESQRTEMQRQIASFHRKIEELRTEATRHQTDLERLRLSIQQAQVALNEFQTRNTPEIRAPRPLALDYSQRVALVGLPSNQMEGQCTMGHCFDYSACPLSSPMSVYVYEVHRHRNILPPDLVLTDQGRQACLFLVWVDRVDGSSLERLEFWAGDGRNHIVMVTGQDPIPAHSYRALIGSTSFSRRSFRSGFDLVVPNHLSIPDLVDEPWRDTPPLLPLHRRFLVSYQDHQDLVQLTESERALFESLRQIGLDQTDDQVSLELNCPISEEDGLCHTDDKRAHTLESSTFTLIPILGPPMLSSAQVQRRLFEALKHNSIPVIIGHPWASLAIPFSEQISTSDFIVTLPLARAGELHYLLRSFPDSDLFHMKRKGSLFWKTYMSSKVKVIRTVVNIVRERLHIPPPPFSDVASPSVFDQDHPRSIMESLPVEMEPSEPLGPLEPPKASVPFRRNLSTIVVDGYARWNERFDPFQLPPSTPWEPVLPTDAKFMGSSVGFRPIGEGVGGAGKEFSQALGGNKPAEQFTVVMLTYERELVLIDALVRLYGLPFLNKVVVVWNSPQAPSGDLQWPDIGVPIEVVRTAVNSLNNRFLPFDVIETEAILSVDDDAHLRHDEIIFGFRVWRENRDQLVGFPGRYHAWDLEHNSWNYNSNYSCELSMVLTGAAFYHKYYNYLYSSVMPKAIRTKVDEFMNCEDLAMNFLISHVTRKPPVKVTSRWTFRCPGCPVSLSEDDTHFQERHKCINFFMEVYGYMPLLFTQFRADSVLFKTRISADKQKCFKFI
ncbi:hypothetical protein TCAL_02823 [Tigriopus californicus]|uniref:glucuronosyl-galactosyl-proteoglycan 4-alpha-N-acetylglucosaminyltransferase n=1 Tax=Tigriopus californicus TaxID=6832 RepID=A0A553NX43_TIGCA|nr:exostosin-3-like [Tigriopus californicus]TRY69988.1 hypothetical protein TCAL_02823 [Tigriopus californicus]|eukprot:TCALIF_02823-PA protein Name:"Similar to botv Exostosin-3 (Drosophila melanogaster)" AED:0.00 eAED:0.00 QI:0/-1/0/1/-1/1/1/0/889